MAVPLRIGAKFPRSANDEAAYSLAVGHMDAAAATPEDATRIVEMGLWRLKHSRPTLRSVGSLAVVWGSGAVIIWLTDLLFHIALAWTYVFVAASFAWQVGMLIRSVVLARQAERLDAAAYVAAHTRLDSRPAQFERALRLLAAQPVPPLLPIETPKLIQAKIVKEPEIVAYRAATAALADGTAEEADARLVLAAAAAERAPRATTRSLLANGEVWIGIVICALWMIQKYATGNAHYLDNFSLTMTPVVVAFYVWAVRSRSKQTRAIADSMAPAADRAASESLACAWLVTHVSPAETLFQPQTAMERMANLRVAAR
ncbi:hypothetical protein [Frondihabitans sucicola]|uniref:hypothetical protein n=1 Tax=Frondihabitans sucicola TaxID=1268041 RepID=UPI002572273C|nr:hypothetical protein [Frondihabitans sucicola]